ncbi:MAG: amidohydrolase family protein, partial [Chloroflexi bacterium]|nr:amidohydrolase family protein [Chloroflexota bacterium]
MTRYQCISADSHVIEPGNLWLDYIEPKYKSRAPHIVDKGDHDEFTCDGAELMPLGAVAAAGVAPDKITRQGRFATHVPRGGWDPQARMADLAKDGVEAEVVYPTMAMRLFAVKDQDFQRACFNAYNRWVVDFCKAYPHQLKAVGVVPTDDIETAVGELKHCGKLGLAGASIAIYQNPDKHYGDPVYDPLWASAQENDLPVSLHILTERNPKLKRDVSDGIVESQWIQRSLGLMAFSGVFERYPKLHIVSAENDIGWVPYFLERIDYLFDRRRNLYNMNIPRKEKPSETIKRAVYFT